MNRSASIADWKTQSLSLAKQVWETHGQARWQGLSARERLLASVLLGLFGILCISDNLKFGLKIQKRKYFYFNF